MGLQSTELAPLTARSGCGRSGAMRSGFVPKQTEGDTIGTSGPHYVWREAPEDRVATTWTEISAP